MEAPKSPILLSNLAFGKWRSPPEAIRPLLLRSLPASGVKSPSLGLTCASVPCGGRASPDNFRDRSAHHENPWAGTFATCDARRHDTAVVTSRTVSSVEAARQRAGIDRIASRCFRTIPSIARRWSTHSAQGSAAASGSFVDTVHLVLGSAGGRRRKPGWEIE
jgi:hypothetical protein